MLQNYFSSLYRDTMNRAYEKAYADIAATIKPDSLVLDCGSSNGWIFDVLSRRSSIKPAQYQGIEWDLQSAAEGQSRPLDIIQGDLNRGIPSGNETFSCVFALSVLEHLLNPCRFLQECHRVLRPGGRLILLTPNISTYFTAVLILLGKMPSSGPHPDSAELLKKEEIFQPSAEKLKPIVDTDTPVHRHIVVFSYRVLRDNLKMIGFSDITGHGFGLYPFPAFLQPSLERVDPYHSHQMTFSATK